MKNLAHDLNTLTRVYVTVKCMRDEKLESAKEEAIAANYLKGVYFDKQAFALGEVLDAINSMIDENFADIDERGLNGFEREADETSSVAFEDLDILPF